MSEPRYTIVTKITDNKTQEVTEETEHNDGHLIMHFLDGNVSMTGKADFAKVFGPFILKSIGSKIGGLKNMFGS